MARFFGSLSGKGKKENTSCGSASSGLTVHIRGWRSGVKVVCRSVNDCDVISVCMTTGSSGKGKDKEVGSVFLEENKPKWKKKE